MRNLLRVLGLLVVGAVSSSAQTTTFQPLTFQRLISVLNSVVYKGALSGIPATCTIGQLAFITDASSTQKIYACTATNTWTQQGSGAGTSVSGYTTSTITASPMTILSSTHNQGSSAEPICWDTATPRNHMACGDTRNSSGDFVFSYTTPAIGEIDIYGFIGGGSPGGSTGDIQWNSGGTFAGGRCSMDSSQNILCTGSFTAGSGGSVGGRIGLGQGTATAAPSGKVGWMAPTTVTTPFYMTLPAAPVTGFLYSMGASDPTVISFVPTIPQAQIAAAATVFNSGTITLPAGNSVLVGCTSTCAVPVPVPAAGYQICIKNDAGVSTVITLSALGSSAMYPKVDDSGYGTAGTGTMVSTAAAGNKVCLFGRDATHYELGAVNAAANWTVN